MLIVAAKMKKEGIKVNFIRDNTNLIRNLNDERETIPGERPGKLKMEVTRNKFSVFKVVASTADPTMVQSSEEDGNRSHRDLVGHRREMSIPFQLLGKHFQHTFSTGLGSFTLTPPFISENLESSLGNDSPSRPRKARYL